MTEHILQHTTFVDRDVARLFDYRQQRIGELLGGDAPRSAPAGEARELAPSSAGVGRV